MTKKQKLNSCRLELNFIFFEKKLDLQIFMLYNKSVNMCAIRISFCIIFLNKITLTTHIFSHLF